MTRSPLTTIDLLFLAPSLLHATAMHGFEAKSLSLAEYAGQRFPLMDRKRATESITAKPTLSVRSAVTAAPRRRASADTPEPRSIAQTVSSCWKPRQPRRDLLALPPHESRDSHAGLFNREHLWLTLAERGDLRYPQLSRSGQVPDLLRSLRKRRRQTKTINRHKSQLHLLDVQRDDVDPRSIPQKTRPND